MRNLFIANKVVFFAGSGWRRLAKQAWMITMPLFILYATFGDPSIGDGIDDITLWEQRAHSWPMIIFYWCIFLGFYPIRNWLEVKRIVKSNGINPKLKLQYKKVLNLYNTEKN